MKPILFVVLALSVLRAQTPAPNREFEALQAHFEKVVGDRYSRLFEGITTRQQWQERKQQTRRALEKMLWHDMVWPSAPPPATVTHRSDHTGYTVENIVIETAPKLFATANLYLPKTGTKPYPVVLYQCGHANKRYFTRHGAWLATHGIAVLVMDNIEMGEVEFTHHGVYSHAWFHWYSRGFSPLAVELLNARRVVDYLVSRPDVDRNRIGATGRSGGGVTSFYLAALDERIKATAPVSGAFSTNGWVKQRLTFAHCDCQFPVNSHGLVYSEIGALTAPRAQLLCNADADRGFPMDPFNEMVGKMKQVYALYQAKDALRTCIAPGGHNDTEAIRLPVYSFFMKELLGQGTPITSEGIVDEPPPEELVCYRDGLPLDERLSRIDEELIPLPSAPKRTIDELRTVLRNEVFRYHPRKPVDLRPEWGEKNAAQGRRVQRVSFASFDGLRVKALYSLPENMPEAAKLPAIVVVDHRKGIPVWGNEQPFERNQWGHRAVLIVETLDRGSRALENNLRSFADDDPLHHMKRQANVVGTTLESMQVYEVVRSLEFLRSLPNVDPARITVVGKGEMGVNGMYAAILDGRVQRVVLQSPTASHREGPHYPGILRYTDVPQTAGLLAGKLSVFGELPTGFQSATVCRSLPACLR
jgi:cephalosporin-C deacetylase-like acetyl esterase